jgi:hypothetical protein
MTMRALRAVLAALLLALPPALRAQTTPFAALMARLSEPGGFFDSDNLVSNETSYLHVMGALRGLHVKGGAYIGVGPEQNFSYIAEIEPDVAILIDIRRDNALLHLLFKAMFERADTRIEYLCLLYGRPAPPSPGSWRQRPLDSLLAYLDRTPLDTALQARTHAALMQRVERFGVPLTAEDRQTMQRFHDEFAAAGLGLTFTSAGRIGRRNYPTVRRLYAETDREGNQAGYLSSEDRWRRVQHLERADLVIPVIGDLAGPKAMRAIGDYLRETRREVSAFYASNVEMYLFGAGTFPAFVENMRALPVRQAGSLQSPGIIIRSWFNRGGMILPNSVPGHFSSQLLMTIPRFLELTAGPDTLSYWSLVTDGLSVPAPPAGFPRP